MLTMISWLHCTTPSHCLMTAPCRSVLIVSSSSFLDTLAFGCNIATPNTGPSSPIMLIILFLVSHFIFLFVLCGGLSWLPVSFLLHVKYTLLYRVIYQTQVRWYPPWHSYNGVFGSVRRWRRGPTGLGCGGGGWAISPENKTFFPQND